MVDRYSVDGSFIFFKIILILSRITLNERIDYFFYINKRVKIALFSDQNHRDYSKS